MERIDSLIIEIISKKVESLKNDVVNAEKDLETYRYNVELSEKRIMEYTDEVSVLEDFLSRNNFED
mgnify:CR=1 FL=1